MPSPQKEHLHIIGAAFNGVNVPLVPKKAIINIRLCPRCVILSIHPFHVTFVWSIVDPLMHKVARMVPWLGQYDAEPHYYILATLCIKGLSEDTMSCTETRSI